MMMMIPEAWARYHMSEDKRAFYEYNAAIMEPWDGPAAVAFTDGTATSAPRSTATVCGPPLHRHHDGLVVMASETGVLEIPPRTSSSKGRLQPGKMFLVDLQQNRMVPDTEIKAKICRQSRTATGSRTTASNCAACSTRRKSPRRRTPSVLRRRSSTPSDTPTRNSR